MSADFVAMQKTYRHLLCWVPGNRVRLLVLISSTQVFQSLQSHNHDKKSVQYDKVLTAESGFPAFPYAAGPGNGISIVSLHW